jgi:hypothetical protein
MRRIERRGIINIFNLLTIYISFFWKSHIIHFRFYRMESAPMSKPPTRPAPSARSVQRNPARERRAVLAKQDQDLFEMLACGYSYEAMAREMGVSVATLRRRIDRVIAKRSLDAPHRYIHLQVERLNKALALANFAVETRDLKGVDLMMKLVDRLDRYHGLAGRSKLPGPAAPREPPSVLAPPHAPRALSSAKPMLAIAAPDASE